MSDPTNLTFDFWQSYYDSLATTPRANGDEQFDLDAEAEIATVKRKIAEMEAEIVLLRGAISAQQVRLQEIRQRAHLHKKLPDEILTKIFSFSSYPLDFLTLTGHPLWTIRQVSVHWRLVVMSNPMLWTHVKIEFPRNPSIAGFPRNFSNDEHGPLWDRIVNKAVTLVPRSGRVTIDIDFGYQKSDFIPTAVRTLTIVRDALSPRIRELRFTAGHEVMNAFLSQSLFPLAQLESMIWDVRPVCIYQPETDVITPLLGAENLKSLTFCIKSRLIFPIPQWNQVLPSLTKLTIDVSGGPRRTKVTTVYVLDLLAICHNLIDCSVHLDSYFDDDREPSWGSRLPGSLQLLHLQVLRVKNANAVFIEALALPSLKMLSLGIKDYCPLPAEAIIDLVQRSHCSITTFSHHIHEFSFSYMCNPAKALPLVRPPAEQLETILTILPNLEELTTSFAFDEPIILNQIAQGTLLPNIRSICCGTTQDPVDLLERLSPRFRRNSQPTGTRSLTRAIVFPHWVAASQLTGRFEACQERIVPLAQEYNRVCVDIQNEEAFRMRVSNAGWSSDEISC